MNVEHHEMTRTAECDGLYVFECPQCGRKMLIRFLPKFEKTVVNDGDIHAVHTGGMGGASMGSARVTPKPGWTGKDHEWLDEMGVDLP